MADRYWVGGTASWDGTAGTKWATTSGGVGGASVPTSADDVFFDVLSVLGNCTIATGNTGAKSITCTGFTGTLTGTAAITVSGSVTLATGMTYSHTGLVTFDADATINTTGKSFSSIDVNGSGITVQLGAAYTSASNQTITVTQGTFTTNNYTVTTSSLLSNNSNTRTINLGSSTVSIGSTINFTTGTNLTLNAGTSQINFTGQTGDLLASGQTFYNVTWTSSLSVTRNITGSNTYNNLQFTSPSTNSQFTITGNQTVNGSLRLSTGSSSLSRVLYVSSIIGTQISFKINSLASVSDCDFRDITVDQTGTVTTITGTRLGDCGGNNYITFPTPKTVYRVGTATSSFLENSWSNTSGGTANTIYYPLPQDTAVFDDNTTATSILFRSSPNPNVTFANRTVAFTANFNFVAGSTHYGDFILSSAITISGGARAIFFGRGIQNITSAGRQITFPITVDTFTGTVRLNDAYSVSSGNSALILTSGTFDANDYNATFTSTSNLNNSWGFNSSGTLTRTVNIGSGTWLFTQTSNTGNKTLWNCSTSTNLTVTGTGVISFGGTTQKTFAGGGIQTYPTINQNSAGALNISGSNKFIDITNTYSATGATTVRFTSGTTNIFDSFNLTGTVGKVCTLGASTTSQATLQKSSSWLMGANSTNGGNNTGLSFTAGGGIDYLSVSYINGTVVTPSASNTNFFLMFG